MMKQTMSYEGTESFWLRLMNKIDSLTWRTRVPGYQLQMWLSALLTKYLRLAATARTGTVPQLFTWLNWAQPFWSCSREPRANKCRDCREAKYEFVVFAMT